MSINDDFLVVIFLFMEVSFMKSATIEELIDSIEK